MGPRNHVEPLKSSTPEQPYLFLLCELVSVLTVADVF